MHFVNVKKFVIETFERSHEIVDIKMQPVFSKNRTMVNKLLKMLNFCSNSFFVAFQPHHADGLNFLKRKSLGSQPVNAKELNWQLNATLGLGCLPNSARLPRASILRYGALLMYILHSSPRRVKLRRSASGFWLRIKMLASSVPCPFSKEGGAL